MKKLLLAFIITLGIALPSMAKNCDKYYGVDSYTDDSYVYALQLRLYKVVENHDLECLKYFVDEQGIDIQVAESWAYPQGYGFISDALGSQEMLSYLLKHGIKPRSQDMDKVLRRASKNFSKRMYDKDLEFLLNEGGEDTWEAINEDIFIRTLIEDCDNPGSISPILVLAHNENIPVSTCERFIKYIDKYREWLTKYKKEADYDYQGIIDSRMWLTSRFKKDFEEAKEKQIKRTEKRNKEMQETVNNNIDNFLRKINDDKLRQYEKEYN